MVPWWTLLIVFFASTFVGVFFKKGEMQTIQEENVRLKKALRNQDLPKEELINALLTIKRYIE